jgi:hypothetical protein
MIIEHLREHYKNIAENEKIGGNPTGSRVGDCVAKLQFLRFPEQSKPTKYQARDMMKFEHGRIEESWLNDKLLKTLGMEAVGFSQEPFYFQVPLADDEFGILAHRIETRKLWGKVVDMFLTPQVNYTPGEAKPTHRNLLKCNLCGVLRREHKGEGWCNKMAGFILDRMSGSVWVPTYPDWLVVSPQKDRMVVLEGKSMSNFGFRDALNGNIGFKYLAQLAVMHEALKHDVVMIATRKETHHLVELEFSSRFQKGRLLVTRLNGKLEEFDLNGDEPDLPPDQEWDLAKVESPYASGLLEQIRDNVKRVLLFDGNAGPGSTAVHRQYGPDFKCPTCGGTGTQTLRKGAKIALKEPKPCESCNKTGKLDRAELRFPCSYCPVVRTCYPHVTLEVDDRPHYYINRDEHVASGITFTAPPFRA